MAAKTAAITLDQVKSALRLFAVEPRSLGMFNVRLIARLQKQGMIEDSGDALSKWQISAYGRTILGEEVHKAEVQASSEM